MTVTTEKRGRGRPRLSPTEPTVEFTVCVPASIAEQLQAMGPTKAAAVREILERHLRRRGSKR